MIRPVTRKRIEGFLHCKWPHTKMIDDQGTDYLSRTSVGNRRMKNPRSSSNVEDRHNISHCPCNIHQLLRHQSTRNAPG